MIQEKENIKNTKEFCTDFEHLQGVIDIFSDIFHSLANDADISSQLLALNMQDSFSEQINHAINNPIETAFDGLMSIEKSTMQFIQTMIEKYLQENRQAFEEIYRHNSTTSASHYSIILKDDSMENKSVMYRFLTKYNNKKYASRFPVFFQHIPRTLLPEFKEEIKGDRGNFVKIM